MRALEECDYGFLDHPDVLPNLKSMAMKVSLAREKSRELARKLVAWPAQFAGRLQ